MTRYSPNDNRITSVCFTGHRDIEPSEAKNVPALLKSIIKESISRGATRFLAGGAVGFDTIAALCVLELKREFPDITLELILPCTNQAQKWSERNRMVYEMIIERADRVEYLHQTYTPNCMHDRNRRLVDEADLVIAYLSHSGGGTAYTVAYALQNDKELINVYDFQ